MIVRTTNKLSDISDIYRLCFSNSSYNSYFSSYPIIKSTDSFFYRLRWKSPVKYYIVYEKQQPILIAGFRNKDGETLVPLGGMEGYGCCDFVYGTDDIEKIESAVLLLFSHIKGKKIWLRFIRYDSPLLSILEKNNMILGEVKRYKNTAISLDYTSYDQYFSMLSKHVRQNLRTARNRLTRDRRTFSCVFYTVTTPADVLYNVKKECLDLYFRRQAVKYKKNKFRNNVHRYFNWAVNSIVNERSTLATINIDGKICAFLSGGLNSSNNRFEVPRLAIDKEYAHYSPGMLLVDEIVKHMIEGKCVKSFDLTRGDEEYKRRMGGENYNTLTFTIEV